MSGPAAIYKDWPKWARIGAPIFAAFVLLIIVSVATAPPKKPAAAILPTTTTTAAPTTTKKPRPTTTRPARATTTSAPTTAALVTAGTLPAAKANQVQAILNGNIDHYATTFATGEAALRAGGNAFYDWRHSSNIEQDLSVETAFKQADAFYTAENEPQSISNWRDDTNQIQADASSWVSDAAGFQIQQVSDQKLAADAAKVQADITAARQDVRDVVAGK